MDPRSYPHYLVRVISETMKDLVRSDSPDLSARQFAVLTRVYLTDQLQTVRGLAAELNVSKPAITRALDRLGEFDLARRQIDQRDRRSVNVMRTVKGTNFIEELASITMKAAQGLEDEPSNNDTTKRSFTKPSLVQKKA